VPARLRRHDAHGHPLAGVAVARRAAEEVEEAAVVEAEARVPALEPLRRLGRGAELVVVARHKQHRVVRLVVLEVCGVQFVWLHMHKKQRINGNAMSMRRMRLIACFLTQEVPDAEAVARGPVVVRLVGGLRFPPPPSLASHHKHLWRRRRRHGGGGCNGQKKYEGGGTSEGNAGRHECVNL
jgi:hypothetical protein